MILVTGGTGLVGAHLLYFLVKAGHKVRAILRKESDIASVKHVFSYFDDHPDELFESIEWMEANLLDLPALTKAFKNITVVYHAAAYVSFNPSHFHKLKKANIEGTANIVNLCLHNNVSKLCHFSSVATLSKGVGTKAITEDSHWNPDEDSSVYALTKYGAEMEVWRGTQEGLDAVILNPGLILGSGFWQSGTGAFFTKINNGFSFYTTGINTFVDVVDVVKIAMQLTESTVKNERFIICSENDSFENVFRNIALALQQKPPSIQLKLWQLRWVYVADRWMSVFGRKQSLFKSTIKAAASQRKYANQKVCETLLYRFTPLSETIQRVAADFKKDHT